MVVGLQSSVTVQPKPHRELLSQRGDQIARVALKMDENRIIPARIEEATIHSFAPTTEYAGVPVKLNGDFTTDPSRKNVDLNATSNIEFSTSCSVLCEAICAALQRQTERPGLFGALTNQPSREGRFRPVFWKTISSQLGQIETVLPGGFNGAVTSLRLRPEWLNYSDYVTVCAGCWPYLDRYLLVSYPELELFLSDVGARRLTLEEVVEHVSDNNVSMRGRVEVFARCIAEFRFEAENDKWWWLRQLPLFPTRDAVCAADSGLELAALDPKFLPQVTEIVDTSDLAFVLKRLGIQVGAAPKLGIASQHEAVVTERVFQNRPAIARWRSAERNTLEYIKALGGVLSVADVSQANLGHDLEVTMKSGARKLIEVKSVASFDEPFRLTSNEYATASSARTEYVLAIVVNGNEFGLKFICDPVRTLSFERRCERWSWQCSEYASFDTDPDSVFRAE
jgi:hypothetical protein